MDFDLDDEQRELRDAARRFLERETPTSYARAMMDVERGYRQDIWTRMASLGWLALSIPTEHDGLGVGYVGTMLLLAEMGRVVLPGPFLSTVVAAAAIADAGTAEQRARLLPGIASGDTVATLAAGGDLEVRAGTLQGEHRFVLDGAVAEVVVAVARSSDGASLFLAEPTSRTPAQTLDLTRRTAHLRFDGARAERLGSSDDRHVARALDRAAVAVAAEMLGCAERVLELSVAYAADRMQFGRPIGSFQAVKHRLADMLVDVEAVRNTVYYAAWALERDHEQASVAASMAKACASDAAPRVAKSGIQVHGGIGFTWEHDMHMFLKRLKLGELAFGDATHHRERMASLLRARA